MFAPGPLPPIMLPPELLPDPLLPLMPPPLFGLVPEVLLEFEHPAIPATAIALSQTARTTISVCRRIVAPFAEEFVPARGCLDSAPVPPLT